MLPRGEPGIEEPPRPSTRRLQECPFKTAQWSGCSLIQRLSHLRWEKTKDSLQILQTCRPGVLAIAPCTPRPLVRVEPQLLQVQTGQARFRSPPRPWLSKLLVVGLTTALTEAPIRSHPPAQGTEYRSLADGAFFSCSRELSGEQPSTAWRARHLWGKTEEESLHSEGPRNGPRRAWPPWSVIAHGDCASPRATGSVLASCDCGSGGLCKTEGIWVTAFTGLQLRGTAAMTWWRRFCKQ